MIRNMNKLIISSILAGVLFVGSLALAEDNVPIATNVPKSSSVRAKMQEQKDRLKQEVKNARTQLKNTTEAVREDIKKSREEFNDSVKAKRAELDDKIKVKREELKTRLQKIKDERKKQTVENIDRRMDALNDKIVRHLSGVLDKLGEMLVRISERADKASVERGLDVSAVRSAIDKANTAIASARSAVETQCFTIAVCIALGFTDSDPNSIDF